MSLYEITSFSLNHTGPARNLSLIASGFLKYDEREVYSPAAKFGYEEARHGGVRGVHFRCLHNNKYLVRQANTDWITATATEAVEDTNRRDCTLFRLNIRPDGSMMWTHVNSGRDVVMVNPSDLINGYYLTIRTFSISNVTCTPIDVERIIKLPKIVVFKADNDKYLIQSGQLSFVGDDRHRKEAWFETVPLNNGDVRFKSIQNNQFLRRDNSGWILANAPVSTDSNTVFRIARLGDNTIALINQGNNRFCQRMPGNDNRFKAEVDSGVREAGLSVEEPIVDRRIEVEYRLDDARVFGERPRSWLSQVAFNAAKEGDLETTLTIYLSVTRPDLSYAVHILSRFMHQPRTDHMDAAMRVVRYLKGSPGQGILLRSDSDLTITGWCDSDWGTCAMTRRSVTGWYIFLGSSPISWKTRRQHTVSLSSAEAEYRSMANIVCELKWLKGLLNTFGITLSRPMAVFSDSASALQLASNPVFHERTKHIEIDCHFVRDAITEGLIVTSHVSTKDQLADILTKALGTSQFLALLRKLGTLDLHAPACGGFSFNVTTTVSTNLTSTTTVEASVPLIARGTQSIEISGGLDVETGLGNTEDKSESYEFTCTVLVPPGQKRRARVMALEAKCDVPFSYLQTDAQANGVVTRTNLQDGIFKGMNGYEFHVQVYDPDQPTTIIYDEPVATRTLPDTFSREKIYLKKK